MGLLDGNALSGVFAAGFSWLYGDAIYTVDGAVGGTVYDPTPGQPQDYPCKAQRDEWGAYDRQGGLVSAKDWKVLVLCDTLRGPDGPIEPVEGGRITIKGITLTIISDGGSAPAVSADPAGAAWVLRCRL